MSVLSVKHLDEQLKDLVRDWERFCLYLPNITYSHIDTIKKENQHSVSNQKLALFDKWLHIYPKASWESVILALELVEENSLADKIRKQAVTPVVFRPTKHEMKEKLNEIIKWESFALHLPEIREEDIDFIKEKIPDDPNGQKECLIERWLEKHPSPTWKMVILALVKADKKDLAQKISAYALQEIKIRGEIIQRLSVLHDSFARLSFNCTKAIRALVEGNKLSLSELKLHMQSLRAVYNFQGDTDINDIDKFLGFVSSYYNFLDCKLLVTIVEQFLQQSDLLESLKKHVQEVQKFKDTTEIRHLRDTLHPYIKKWNQEEPIIITVDDLWGKASIGVVHILLGTLLSIELRDITKLFRIISGSLTIVLLVPQHTTHLFIKRSKEKIELFRQKGVTSLQIENTYIFQDENKFQESTNVINYKAQFLQSQDAIFVAGRKDNPGLADLRDKWFHVEAKITEIQAKLDAQSTIKEIAQNDEQLQRVEQKVKSLSEKCNKLEEEKRTIQLQIKSLEGNMEKNEKALKNAENNTRKKSDAIEENTQKEFQKVHGQLESMKQDHQEQSDSLVRLSTSLDELSKRVNQEMRSLREDMEGLNDKLREMSTFREGMEDLNDKLQSIEQKTSTLQDEMQKYTTEVRGLRGELSSLKMDRTRPMIQRPLSARQYIQSRSTEKDFSQKRVLPLSQVSTVLGISKDDASLLGSGSSSDSKAYLPEIGERPERHETPRQKKHPGRG